MEFIDLKAQYRYLKEEINANIQHVLDGAQFILGDYVEEFEKKLADFVGVKHAISCSDGTAALQLIFMANGIGKGDAVFCPDMTFIASIEPACLLGAVPVFCEIEPETYNMSADSLERQIQRVQKEGKRTPKAIVAVDFLGNPADYDRLKEIAGRYHLLLIEDAAQSMGASYQGVRCGALGDVAATSFFPSKPLGCYGDGGAVFTNDDSLAGIIRSLRVHGKGKSKYDNIRIGINSRLDSIQAAVLLPKLRVLEEEIQARQRVAGVYTDHLKEKIRVPVITENAVSSYAQYVLMAKSAEQRKLLQDTLSECGIPTIRYYPTPLHQLPVFENIDTYGESYDISEAYADCSFGIPFSPYIGKDEQMQVTDCLLRVLP